MKKQIAILATVLAASGFTAFGQGYMTIGSSAGKLIWDDFTTPGVGVVDDNMDFTVLFAATGTADLLSSVGGTANQYGLGGTAASNQVATNGVASVGAVNPFAEISSMLSGGWQVVTNESALGSMAVGTLVGSGKTAGTFSYNGGDNFEFNGGSSTVEVTYDFIVLAWDSTSSTYVGAADLGWSNPFKYVTGSTSGDGAGLIDLNGGTMNQFGVAAVPEPTTLALAGLGGLSMLFLRRRKA
jgi:hypothetical protein